LAEDTDTRSRKLRSAFIWKATGYHFTNVGVGPLEILSKMIKTGHMEHAPEVIRVTPIPRTCQSEGYYIVLKLAAQYHRNDFFELLLNQVMKENIGPTFRAYYFAVTFATALRTENDTARRILVKSIGENPMINTGNVVIDTINAMTERIVRGDHLESWTDDFTLSLLQYIFSYPTDTALARPLERSMEYIRFNASDKKPKTVEYLTRLIL
jgi:hypothetical protein